MKSSQRSCPVRHDGRFLSLRLCEGCVKAGCPDREFVESKETAVRAAWPPVFMEPVYAECEPFE